MAEGENIKAGKPGLDILFEQHYRNFQRSSVSGDAAERETALNGMVSVLVDQITLGNLTGEELARLQKLAPTLFDKAQNIKLTLSEDGKKKTLELRKSIGDTDRQLLEKESKDVFDMLKSGFQPSIGLLGTVKSFALLFKAFGVDTTELVAKCDEMIMEEKAKFKHNNAMDHENVYKAKTGIKTSDVEAGIDITEKKIRGEVAGNTGELRDVMIRTGERMKPDVEPPKKEKPATSDGLQTSRFLDAAKEITQKDGKNSIASKVALDKMIKMAANGDENAQTISAQEVGNLETLVTKSLNSQKVNNAAEEAHKLIERVRARANEPAPQPS